MDLPQFLTLPFWNHLARGHMSELIMILTAAVMVLADRYVRRWASQFTNSHGPIYRFGVYLVVCSVIFGGMTLGTAWLVRNGLLIKGGAYIALVAAAVFLVVTIDAQRQKQA